MTARHVSAVRATSVDWCHGDLEHQPTSRRASRLKAGIHTDRKLKHNPGWSLIFWINLPLGAAIKPQGNKK